MIEEFTQSIQVASDARSTWEVLLDVPRVASWLPIVRDVREVVPLRHFEALLEDRLGPFRLRADLDIWVDDIQPFRLIRARAEGEDRQVGSRIKVDGMLELEPVETGSIISIAGTYEVTGRVATLGASSIRRKAGSIVDAFSSNVSRDLDGGVR